MIDGPGRVFYLANGQRHCIYNADPVFSENGHCIFCGEKSKQ